MNASVPIFLVLAGTLSAAAVAGDVLERKAGLWKITMQGTSATVTHTADQCLASDTDAQLARQGMATMKSICSKFETRKVGKTFVIDSVCMIGTHASVGHSVTTVDGDSAYHTVVTTHADGPANPSKPDSVSTQDGRWAGACPAGMKPGDQILQVGPQMPGGMKTNLLNPSPAR